ncbi:hypothetical protein [Paenibacillus bovis]|uniref:Uncharacterized protein n=1 Tax=Paenibacillus bovis TaxID=1616788 RepID=A0A1X9T3X3_9BACL|nr:hypothetical protein [Paenibacillus bovis]ARR10675.1 hypothetical protein AR543_p0067 [Paenibacillus bovis]
MNSKRKIVKALMAKGYRARAVDRIDHTWSVAYTQNEQASELLTGQTVTQVLEQIGELPDALETLKTD